MCHLALALGTKLVVQSVSLTELGGREHQTKKTGLSREPHRMAANDRQQVPWDGLTGRAG